MNTFTIREKEVLYYILIGLNNREIAEKLIVSPHTIKAHVASIYRKLGATNRIQAVVKSVKLGAIEYFEIKDYETCKNIQFF